MEQALDRFGRIDSLINNAGIFIAKPFTVYTVDDYVAVSAVNLAGFFHITQRAIRQMVTQGSGHIVNISTSLVENADSKRPSALATLAKGGLAAVTRSLAVEFASRGVRVNAVSLGVIRTPLHDPVSYEGLAGLHPLGRLGEIGDVVDGILYLEQATFVTGEILHIDGGQAAGYRRLERFQTLRVGLWEASLMPVDSRAFLRTGAGTVRGQVVASVAFAGA